MVRLPAITWFLGLFLVFSWIYSNLVPINLTLLLPLYLVYKKNQILALWSAFSGGLVFDLVNLTTLGVSSSIFLVLVVGLGWWQDRSDKNSIWLIGLTILLADLACRWLVFGQIQPVWSLSNMLIGLIGLGLIKKLPWIDRNEAIYLK
jgi:cell shape-determining protein MreD